MNGGGFATYRASLEAFDRESAYAFIEEELRYNDHLFHMRRLTDIASDRAFHYLMTGNSESAHLAITAIEAIMQFERWDYFLDGDEPIGFQRASRATTAVSLCIDWLADLIEEAQRDRWIRMSCMLLSPNRPIGHFAGAAALLSRVGSWITRKRSTGKLSPTLVAVVV